MLTNENRLSIINPELCRLWNYKRNKLTPDKVSFGSDIRAWWICEKGHEWEASIWSMKNKRCPYCFGRKVCNDNCLTTTEPELSKEWNYKKNDGLTPNDITKGSDKKVWWVCDKGHEWQAAVYSRSGDNKNGCPYCSGKAINNENCLERTNPEIAKEWDYSKNGKLTPKDVSRGASKKAWWKCDDGHEWKAYICIRTSQNTGCPYCKGKRLSNENNFLFQFPETAKEWDYDKNKISPDKVTSFTNDSYWWKCSNGHSWKTRVSHRANGASGCPYCSKIELKDGKCFQSLVEAFWYLEFKSLGEIFECDKKYGKGFGRSRFDFYFPSNNLYIEVTSYDEKWKNWRQYEKRIERKREYVENVLKGRFVFVQDALSGNEVERVKKEKMIH